MQITEQIYVGIDDTDLIDTPGTNKLAQHIAVNLHSLGECQLISRHQLLQDPRVPCTNKNGCACLHIAHSDVASIEQLVAFLRDTILSWAPVGSDPGLCVATANQAEAVAAYGRRCQTELLTQRDAIDLAESRGIHLEGLGGTNGGQIGALAAVGLARGGNDGRVIFRGDSRADLFDVTGVLAAEDILRRGVDLILSMDDHQTVSTGSIYVGKRLRPNLRNHQVILFVEPTDIDGHWAAKKLV